MTQAGSPRIVITGLGVICPLGNDPQALWSALRQGRSGVGVLRDGWGQCLPSPFGGEAWEFSGAIDDFGPVDGTVKRNIRKGLKVMCREIQMGVAAAQRALADAQWGSGASDAQARPEPDRTGVVFGADYITTLPEEFAEAMARCRDDQGGFSFTRWGEEGIPQVSPLWLLKYLPNMPACHVAIYNDFRGPNNSITVREASANLAVMEAASTIRRGWADVMVVGATGSRLHPLRSVHIALQETLAIGDDPTKLARPFDQRRSGMVLGEGAAALVLEREDVARKRGARIYGEILGGGSSSVVDRRGVGDRRRAATNVIRQALAASDISPDRLGHVHAHGLGTLLSDMHEGRALEESFQECRQPVPLVAAKSYFGNLGAGSGMVELISSVLAMEHGELFPVLNLERLDPACLSADGKLRPAGASSPAGDSFLNLSFTPYGQASAVVVGRFS